MSKRAPQFERVPQDYYPTPEEAVLPLLPHLRRRTMYAEPCAGNGALMRHLAKHGHICDWACDVAQRGRWIDKMNALDIEAAWVRRLDAKVWITNPPWDRPVLHALIEHLSSFMPCWLLFDADWMHTKQAPRYLAHCRKIVSIGRVRWIEDSDHDGKDNAAWYLFDRRHKGPTEFYGRSNDDE